MQRRKRLRFVTHTHTHTYTYTFCCITQSQRLRVIHSLGTSVHPHTSRCDSNKQVRVGEIRDPPALGSAIQPQDRIVRVNDKPITMHTTHDEAVRMVIAAAAKGPIRFTISRVTAPGQHATSASHVLSALTPPFFLRAACEWPVSETR